MSVQTAPGGGGAETGGAVTGPDGGDGGIADGGAAAGIAADGTKVSTSLAVILPSGPVPFTN